MKRCSWWKDTAAAGIIMLAVVVIAAVTGMSADGGLFFGMGSRFADGLLAGKQVEADGAAGSGGASSLADESGRQGGDAGNAGNGSDRQGEIYPFNYIATRDGKTRMVAQVYYSDDFFNGDNSEYEHQLAKASLALSMSGFEYENAENLLTELAYQDIKGYRYNLKKDEDKVAIAFAHKEIDGCNVIAVCIRGGKYGNEWGSNGRLSGDGTVTGYHYGFNAAAEDALQQLVSYAEEQNIQLMGSRIWLTGYSRGAAVANVLGEKLNSYGMLAPEDLYCYTFATPSTVAEEHLDATGTVAATVDWPPAGGSVSGTVGAGVADAAGGAAPTPGIFNIVNPLDIVARLPMNASGQSQTKSGKTVSYNWDYTKYGTTIRLPGGNADKTLLSQVKSTFRTTTGGKESYDMKNTDIQVVELLEHSLAFATRNPQNYIEKYQDDVVIPLLKENMGKSASDLTRDNILTALISSLPGVSTFIVNELNNLDFKAQLYIGNMVSGAEEQRLLKEHWPETYWAWMQAVE